MFLPPAPPGIRQRLFGKFRGWALRAVPAGPKRRCFLGYLDRTGPSNEAIIGSLQDAQDVVFEEIAPNDFVATPKEVLKSLHRIVELVRRAEIDFLIFQLVKFIEHGFDWTISVEVFCHGYGARTAGRSLWSWSKALASPSAESTDRFIA